MLTFLLACLSRSPAPEPATVSSDSSTPSLVGQFSLTAYPGMDAVGPNGERPMPMSKDYTFTANTYTMDGYPPLTITGRYAVLTTEAERLQIRLTDTVFDGDPSPDREVWVDFSDGGKTLTMEGMTYTRQE
ncbi:MAG: hypothetical protein ACI8RZ_000123 [Myxococcota bacterium]|jgi:hypothetical protein